VESSVLSRSVPPTLESNASSHPQVPYSSSEVQSVSAPSPAAPSSAEQPGFRQEIRVFLSTFVTIFLAELGDKTQVTTLLMSAESNAPWIVFLGAGSALVATSLLGVWLGHWLSKRVSTRTLETAAAAMLLLIAAMLLWDVVQVN
jgi:Ca2+/H+ antiporter, TMEM165/GDT1 family